MNIIMNFNELNLMPQILTALEEKGYQTPSPIQEQAIPHVLNGRDLLGCAQTGTGKTAAFALPILQNLMTARKSQSSKRKIRSLILTPTRELALQISDNFKEYGTHLPLRTDVIFGGVSAVPQIESLRRGIDILIATPGRLNDLIGQGEIDLSFVEIFVLDEADRMLDMGFVHDVKKIIALLPVKRQTLLFSATMPDEIQKLIRQILHDPVEVKVAPVSSTVDLIDAVLYYVDKSNKRELLAYLLKNEDITSTLVFTRTKHGADRVARFLTKSKIAANAIHGDKSQGARQKALNDFKAGNIRVLVATDIAARGIDIDELSCVINFDIPNVPETYVHRIGRTGRAGLGGRAISFCDIDEKPHITDIEKLIRKKIPVIEGHPYPMQVFTPTPKETKQRPSRKEKPAPSSRTTEKPAATPRKKSTPATPTKPANPIKKNYRTEKKRTGPSTRTSEKR